MPFAESPDDVAPLPLEGGQGVSDKREGQIQPQHRPGRKPGSKNRITGDLVRIIAARHDGKLPLQVITDYAMGELAAIERDFKCGALRAGEIKERLLVASLPYTAKKMPQAIDVNRRDYVVVQIGDVGESDQDLFGDEGLTIDATPMETKG